MAEYFDLLSPTGEPLGITKERNAVHRDGDWHPSVHIFVIQGDRVLLQRRKWDKESFPGKLDLACTGHVDAGEDYLTAARRELQEELSLTAGADDQEAMARMALSSAHGAGEWLQMRLLRLALARTQPSAP